MILRQQKGDSKPPAKPSHCTIYVAKSYPPWQHSALCLLGKHYKVSNRRLTRSHTVCEGSLVVHMQLLCSVPV